MGTPVLNSPLTPEMLDSLRKLKYCVIGVFVATVGRFCTGDYPIIDLSCGIVGVFMLKEDDSLRTCYACLMNSPLQQCAGPRGVICGTASHEDSHACGIGCNGGGIGSDMRYVGPGQGGYIQEAAYRYVGYGGNFSNVARSRDFTCCISICSMLTLLLLGLLMWLLRPTQNVCEDGKDDWQHLWSKDKQDFCCRTASIGCRAVAYTPMAMPSLGPVGPVDPFNCADGILNWKAGWSVDKKKWCCKIHGKGCPENGEGWDAVPAAQYDCDAGFANWVKGWSVPKKAWCCQTANMGCAGTGKLSLGQAEAQGYGAGAQHGDTGAPVAAITGIVPHG